MSLVHFKTDARPYHGYVTQYINPDDVSAVTESGSSDNPTRITMKNGNFYQVMGWPDEAALKLAKEEQP
jgi:hypothetical protein